jgi:transposase InsO family protein
MPHAFDLSLAGPFMGHMFLLVVDAHSKWRGSDGPIQSTIQKLRTIHGLLETIVSDNATCFRSAEFKVFLSRNGIQHILSAPYDPATNGLAERAIQTFKEV